MNPIFLDWDGVVIDSTQLYLDVLKQACHAHGKTLPVHDAPGFREWYQPNWEVNFYEVGFTHSQYLQICESYSASLDYNEAPLFPGVEEMVRELSQSFPLVLVSTAPTEPILKRLEGAGLLDCFESVTGSDDGSTDKDRRLAEHLLRLKARRGVMVGDTHLDVEAGFANGLTTVGVTYGMVSEARVQDSRPHFLVRSPEQLARAVRSAANLAAK